MYLSAGSAMANSAEVSWLFLMKVEDFALTVRPTGRELVAFMAGNGETQLSLYTTACKNSVMRCWCGYLSGARCTLFAYGQADATASQNPTCFASFKLRQVLPFWYQLAHVVLEKRPLNGCSGSCCSVKQPPLCCWCR